MQEESQVLLDRLEQWISEITALISTPAVLYQLGIIALLFLAARLISSHLEQRLEAQARNIKGRPSLLRFTVIVLRRMNWAVFVAFLIIVLALMESLSWPDSTQLVYSVLLLSAAWWLISILSKSIRSRFLSRVFAVIGWAYVAILILGISPEAAELLDSAGFSIGNVRVSILLIVKAFFILGAALWAAVSIGNSLEQRIQRSEELTPSLRVLVGKVLKISLIIFAALVAVSGIGIDLTVFTVLSGAIGVGIGFGLQKVVSNFISGIIILADRSIKPGDTISLGDTFGWIRELRARFVSVVTRDGKEYLIPNEDFITQQVINWSFSDEMVRLDVPFGVSYKSDPHEVMRLAIAAAVTVDRVVPTPAPVCWLTAFGDSSLDFDLRFWIRDPQNGLTNVRGQVLLALWDTFKEHGVQIPYPHREIIMQSKQE